MAKYRTLNPATGELIEEFPTASDSDIEKALTAAAKAAPGWRLAELSERTEVLNRAAEALQDQAEALGSLMALEMGKLHSEGIGEAKKCAWACRYYADQAASMLEPEPRSSDGSEAHVRYEALGILLAIMPWNFPFWQFFRFAAPSLAAGNTILLKHAPNTPACAARMVQILVEAGAPAGVVQNLYLTDDQAAAVIGDSRVRGVTLTGSTRAGRAVASTAGKQLKPMVMELGGSDAFIVLEDADLDHAVEQAVTSRCLNSGQSCIAAKRFLVHKKVFDRFREAFVQSMSERTMGDPMESGSKLGPLAREDLRDGLADQVRRSLSAGAKALTGGEVPDGPGFFYPATVLVDVEAGSPAFVEELFGPVASLLRVNDDDHAIQLANDSDYGLGSAIFTADRDRAQRLIPRLEAGSVFVNGFVKSDPRLPFGGIKDSGFGRELGREGLLEFVNQKTVWADWNR